ncbi:MAG TPA: flagellar FliJ family protein [Stellaceae bacterium]|nr:flagellar FliJ family protein [Stellaceae bacterium]
MSALDSLVRIHRWQIDERRRQVADLEALASKLREERRRLDEEELREQRVAAEAPEAAFTYGGYVNALIERRNKLSQSLSEAAQQIQAAREALAEAYQEMKRYEITAASRARRQRLEEERRQQKMLDEIGLDAFRRRASGRAST